MERIGEAVGSHVLQCGEIPLVDPQTFKVFVSGQANINKKFAKVGFTALIAFAP
jgi:hypothetical protein